ncbi:hypothetical protein VV089_22115 [Candidatus Merdisoma sp. JLR.KK011]|uniref:hypothetical protein n=1 Tax=Candidatus Merdisoma sp. JLR.KK011 TaxID=3114299 RepID=UPI002FF189F7
MIFDVSQIFGAAGFLQAPLVGNKPAVTVMGKRSLFLSPAFGGTGRLLKSPGLFLCLLIGFAIAKSVD